MVPEAKTSDNSSSTGMCWIRRRDLFAILDPVSVSSRANAHSQPQFHLLLVADSSTRNLGLRILGVWLLLWALFRFVDLSFAYDHLVLPILGLVAGVLLIIGS